MLKTELSYIQRLGGQLRVVSTPYTYAVAEGEVDDHFSRRVLGYRAALANATVDDIAEIAAATIPVPATATAMELVSTDARDNGGRAITAFADGKSASAGRAVLARSCSMASRYARA